MFEKRNASIQRATESVNEETVRIVDAQKHDMAKQMAALDDFVTKARSRNGVFNDAHFNSLNSLSANVRQSYESVAGQFEGFDDRIGHFKTDYEHQSDEAQAAVAPLLDGIRRPLSDLGADIGNRVMEEDVVTGETPKKTKYSYPTILPRTEEMQQQ